MKKIALVVFLLLFVFSCEAENKILEPSLTKEKIEFPKKELDQGEFMAIFRNQTDDSIAFNLIMVSNDITKDQDSLDYCEGVNALRQGKQILEWTPINFNFSAIAESAVENQNDHPNLISYNLPVGTYLLMLVDSDSCSKDNYTVFNVKENKNFEGN